MAILCNKTLHDHVDLQTFVIVVVVVLERGIYCNDTVPRDCGGLFEHTVTMSSLDTIVVLFELIMEP